MATIEATERCLIRGWDNLIAGLCESDAIRINEARSELASTMAYLLYFFQEGDPSWRDFGADDLLDAQYKFPSPLQMSTFGLMCWGDEKQCLTPFEAEFERDASTGEIADFALYFAAIEPNERSFTIPYTSDEDIRDRLLAARPPSPKDWAHVFRRAFLPTRATGNSSV